MKKIDKFILAAFVGPFSLTFVVVVFIFLTQYLLKYIEDFVGKGVGFTVYVELIFYFSINMMPVSLPLAVLLSCLMVYGNLGEHVELTAIKASGISLLRVLLPIGIVAAALSVGSFYFSDIIVPKANLKAFSLLYDIRQKKPSLDFKEGSFYNGLPGYSVKISKKHEDGRTIEGIVIYNHANNQGNTEVILADSGQMYTFNNDQYLALELFSGNSYSEYLDNNSPTFAPNEFVKNSFQKSKMVFSLASFQLNRTPAQLFSQNRVMRPIKLLNEDIDSMRTEEKTIRGSLTNSVQSFYSYPVGKDDTLVPPSDSVFSASLEKRVVDTKLSQSLIYSRAANSARGIKAYLGGAKDRLEFTRREIRQYKSEKLKKYTQACACFIMFLIGAPLGAIIKKGGFGVPVIISIGFFILYYVVTMIGEKWAKEAVTSVPLGMWLGNIILFPIGIFFLRQAWKDSRLLETDFYVVQMGRIRNLVKRKAVK